MFEAIVFAEDFFWKYIGWSVIILLGFYLTFFSKFFQLRAIFSKDLLINNDKNMGGIHPLKLYFASVGGMIGLGNIISASVAIMIGGPGSLFWMLVAMFFGMIIKYSEVYLGVKCRIEHAQSKTINGGPMFVLRDACKTRFLHYLFSIIMCLYGIEIFNFVVVVDSIEQCVDLNRNAIVLILIICILYVVLGDISRLSNFCSIIMPVFMVTYIALSLYIIYSNSHLLMNFLAIVWNSAFTGHAQLGGFVGSTFILTAYMGISKAVYSGDVAVGFDSIIQSQTSATAKQQATISMYALCSDTFICLLTNTMLGVTGAWYKLNNLSPSQIIHLTLSHYIGYSEYLMSILLIFAGFTTIVCYLSVGIKCANFLNPVFGKRIYLIMSIIIFVFFCNFRQTEALVIMGFLCGLLVLLNAISIYKLKNIINFY